MRPSTKPAVMWVGNPHFAIVWKAGFCWLSVALQFGIDHGYPSASSQKPWGPTRFSTHFQAVFTHPAMWKQTKSEPRSWKHGGRQAVFDP